MAYQQTVTPRVLPHWLNHPRHLSALSKSLGAFWWLYNRLSVEDVPYGGEVLGGRVIKLGDVAAELKITERSVRHQIKSLGEAGYLRKRFASRGVRIELKLWKWDEGFGGFVPAEGLDHSPVRQKDVRHQKPCMTIKRESKDSVSPEIVMQQRPARQMGAMQDVLPARFLSRGAPPLNNPPNRNKELLREYKEPPPTNLVPYMRGISEDHANVGSNEQANRWASPAIKELNRNLSRIPEYERPDKTKALEKAFMGLSLGGINQVFEYVWMERNKSGHLDNLAGWWAGMLVRYAEKWKKIDPNTSSWG